MEISDTTFLFTPVEGDVPTQLRNLSPSIMEVDLSLANQFDVDWIKSLPPYMSSLTIVHNDINEAFLKLLPPSLTRLASNQPAEATLHILNILPTNIVKYDCVIKLNKNNQETIYSFNFQRTSVPKRWTYNIRMVHNGAYGNVVSLKINTLSPLTLREIALRAPVPRPTADQMMRGALMNAFVKHCEANVDNLSEAMDNWENMLNSFNHKAVSQ